MFGEVELPLRNRAQAVDTFDRKHRKEREGEMSRLVVLGIINGILRKNRACESEVSAL